MIQSIELQNFQSHEDTKLIFSPGVNSIIGSSDSGKTAILRGLRKASHNKPGGDSFRSNWGGDTLIKVETSDEEAITRVVTDKANTYSLDTPDDTQMFKAFGQGVPEEIKQALNMDDENIQAQMDAPFLFSASDGDVAKRLNKAANLEIIGTSQSYLDKKKRTLRSDIKTNKNDLKTKKEELAATDFLDKASDLLKVLEDLSKDLNQKENTTSELSLLITELEESDNKLSKFDFIKDALEEYNKLLQLSKDCSSKELLVDDLEELEDSLKSVETSLNKTIDLKKAKEILNLLEVCSKNVQGKESDINTLADIIDSEKELSEEIEEVQDDHKENKEKFDKLMPDTCPLCGDIDD